MAYQEYNDTEAGKKMLAKLMTAVEVVRAWNGITSITVTPSRRETGGWDVVVKAVAPAQPGTRRFELNPFFIGKQSHDALTMLLYDDLGRKYRDHFLWTGDYEEWLEKVADAECFTYPMGTFTRASRAEAEASGWTLLGWVANRDGTQAWITIEPVSPNPADGSSLKASP